MIPAARHHITRLQTAILKKYTARSLARWVAENTFYAGMPYSYVGHEYQEKILSDDSRVTNTQKCSQVGLSEANARRALAVVNVMSPYTLAYTLPTAKFAATFMQTRVQPMIDGSPYLKSAIHKTLDNNEVKRFGDSFIYVRGAASSNAPISIPCDHLVHDEVDFSDQETLGQYISRLTHSKWQRIDRISTPTLPNFGINKHFRESRRNYNFVKCCHCNHHFIPDYYKHVKLPYFDGDLREITKANIIRYDWAGAKLHCPNCRKVPDLSPQFREWVCENPDDNFEGVGYQVSPFDAPTIVTCPQLVVRSTEYDRIQDFVNFSLGLPMEDKEATLAREDFEGVFQLFDTFSSTTTVMGVDVGNTYHFTIASVDGFGALTVLHYERVPMSKAKEKYFEFKQRFHVMCTVIDSGPHAETVMSLQERDSSCYAAVYTKMRGLTTHNVVDKEEEEDNGEDFVRQVNVNRNRAFDAYMNLIRQGNYRAKACEEMSTVIDHHISMKRARIFDAESGEMSFSWQKSDGIDHYHHSGLYCYIASKIKGASRQHFVVPGGLAFKFQRKGSF